MCSIEEPFQRSFVRDAHNRQLSRAKNRQPRPGADPAPERRAAVHALAFLA